MMLCVHCSESLGCSSFCRGGCCGGGFYTSIFTWFRHLRMHYCLSSTFRIRLITTRSGQFKQIPRPFPIQHLLLNFLHEITTYRHFIFKSLLLPFQVLLLELLKILEVLFNFFLDLIEVLIIDHLWISLRSYLDLRCSLGWIVNDFCLLRTKSWWLGHYFILEINCPIYFLVVDICKNLALMIRRPAYGSGLAQARCVRHFLRRLFPSLLFMENWERFLM